MRRCYVCKQKEGLSHLKVCSYYAGQVALGQVPFVETHNSLIEDTEGCPYSFVTATVDCPGCIECMLEN